MSRPATSLTSVVPYVDPGLRLARHVRSLLRDFQTRHGTTPRVLYLRNHGLRRRALAAHEKRTP